MDKYFPCKYNKIVRALKKLGLSVVEGKRHSLAECIPNGRKTTIPRHRNKDIKPEIVKSIIEFLLEKKFEEEKISILLR